MAPCTQGSSLVEAGSPPIQLPSVLSAASAIRLVLAVHSPVPVLVEVVELVSLLLELELLLEEVLPPLDDVVLEELLVFPPFDDEEDEFEFEPPPWLELLLELELFEEELADELLLVVLLFPGLVWIGAVALSSQAARVTKTDELSAKMPRPTNRFNDMT